MKKSIGQPTAAKPVSSVADVTPLPITLHALKRQSKRAKTELEKLLGQAPSSVSLMQAQEFVAHIWGRTSWGKLIPSEVDASSGVSAPSNAISPAPPAAPLSQKDFLDNLGVARVGNLIKLFSDSEKNRHSAISDQLCDILARIESSRNIIYTAATRAISERSTIAQEEVFIEVQPPLNEHFRIPFSFRSFDYWLDLDNLENFAWRFQNDALHSAELGEAVADLRFFLCDLACYDRNRVGRRGGQCEDTRVHFGAIARPLRPAFKKLATLLDNNSIFWPHDSLMRNVQELLSKWPPFRASWICAEEISFGFEFNDFSRWLEDQCRINKRDYSVFDALQLVSYGINTSTTKTLFEWMRNPDLLRELSTDLVATLVKIEAQQESERRLAFQRIDENRAKQSAT